MTAGDPANWSIVGAHRAPLQLNALASYLRDTTLAISEGCAQGKGKTGNVAKLPIAYGFVILKPHELRHFQDCDQCSFSTLSKIFGIRFSGIPAPLSLTQHSTMSL
jgi:hypothetical protein